MARSGYGQVHSMVDGHSWLAYSEVLSDGKGPTSAASLDRAIDYCAGQGISRVERLMTDNAWAHRWSLREACARHRIRQKFIRTHLPWHGGACGDRPGRPVRR